MSFTKEQLESYRDQTVPDLLGDGCRLLFVGINPGLWTAATQTHFCHPTNRFYPALRRSGLIDWDVEVATGITDAQRHDFLSRGMGITNLVARATARASELSSAELKTGTTRLAEVVSRSTPKLVAILGITAYRTGFSRRAAVIGPQPEGLGASELWVIPNPSGLNAHETIDSLAGWFGRIAEAAGIKPQQRS